jgi:transcriptional regulator with XRE-family HTH domain
MARPRTRPLKETDNRIAELRALRGLSITQMADKVNANLQTYHDVETGKTRLSLDWMRRIARALEVAPSELLLPSDLKYELTDKELELLALIRALPDDRRNLVPGIIASIKPDQAA